MHLPANINDVLNARSVESERLEFKKGWNPEAVLHSLCAFANDFHNLGGGYIFIGLAEDHGRPVLPPAGLNPDQLESIQKELLNLGFTKIQPAYHPVVEPYVIDGRHVLVLLVPGGQNRPYKAADSLSKDNRSFSYYIRKTCATVKASRMEEVELISLAARVPYDDRSNQVASIQDLKLPLILTHLKSIGSQLANEATTIPFDLLCRQMSIIDGPQESVFPRNVGLLFFNEHPDTFFPQTQIDVVQFPEGLGGDRLIEKTFRGPVGQMLQDALRYIDNSVLREFIVKHSDRAEADRFFNYPYAAIEEALVNAVYHRSYEEREPIEVRVLPDQITVTSYPGADNSISLRDLAEGRLVARRYRNRRIGEFLKELRLAEGRGTGVPKIKRAMRDNGSPEPAFVSDVERTFFVVTIPIHLGAAPKTLPQPLRGLSVEQYDLLDYCLEVRDRQSIRNHMSFGDDEELREGFLLPLIRERFLEVKPAPTLLDEKAKAPQWVYQTTARGAAVLRRYKEEESGRNSG